jgi:membrane-bound ClpP family serine protease
MLPPPPRSSGLATMKRYSMLWWWLILPTSLVVGVPTFFLAGHFTGLLIPERLAIAVFATLIADVVIAASMEAAAPTKLNIGPGERALESDTPMERATVICGFDSSPHGRVSVRGETWMATRLAGDSGALAEGMSVRVVDRDGLQLIVASSARQLADDNIPGDPDSAGA